MRKNVLTKSLCLAAAIAILIGSIATACWINFYGFESYAAETSIRLPEPAPISASAGGGSAFAGWYLTPDFTGTKYMPGDEITVYDALLKDNNVDLYAKWSDYTVKYAVSIYGINQDEGENGTSIGLTFGPATDADYTKSYKACPGTSAEDPGDCVHWMTWDQIIANSKTDPTIFQKCLENGCTHSVELTITGELAEGAKNYSGEMDDGDGAGMLFNSIASSYRKWNNEQSNTGGWPVSRIRATLNGLDSQTDVSVAGDDCLDEDICLLAMFPKELRDNIIAKAVKSDTVYNDLSGNNVVTYDKLWLFSVKEIYDAGGTKDNWIRTNEGELYQYPKIQGVTISNFNSLKNYEETGSANFWWLRSATRNFDVRMCLVKNDGDLLYEYADSVTRCGIAPGFCLPGPAKQEPYTVKYAVCLWGINQDHGKNGETLGLTFGPTTCDSYINSHKACSGTSAENPGNCLHWMSWNEIIEKSESGHAEDFAACLENGCTHSVNLKITGSLKGTKDYSGKMDDGDGAGILYDSIASGYIKWNYEDSNSGGWPASRMRATLNGVDDQTDTSVAGIDCLDEDNCLLAMFPEDLQKGIVAKAVKSDIVYGDLSGNNVTTFDKLWLFSGKEVYGDSGKINNVIRPNEGELYQRSEKLGITTSANSAIVSYTESGSADDWWLRSAYRTYSNTVCLVTYYGGWSYYNANTTYNGVAPGFCLK